MSTSTPKYTIPVKSPVNATLTMSTTFSIAGTVTLGKPPEAHKTRPRRLKAALARTPTRSDCATIRLRSKRAHNTISGKNPFRIMAIETVTKRIANNSLILSGGVLRSNRVPTAAPITTPIIKGATRKGCTSPRTRKTEELAAAVTPIMKLLVAEATFTGTLDNKFIVGTPMIPPPTPRRPDTTPEMALIARVLRVFVTSYRFVTPVAGSKYSPPNLRFLETLSGTTPEGESTFRPAIIIAEV